MTQYINSIISESVDQVLNKVLYEGHKKNSAKIAKILNGLKKDSDEPKKKKKNIRKKKIRGGKTIDYDYDYYQRTNSKVSEGSFESIINAIDMELVDLAAVARKVFPDHTDEGAQSQLRKILLGERPMTRQVAHKLNKMIAAGEIPTK